ITASSWAVVSPLTTLAGIRMTGRTHPMSIGTCTRADCATRTGVLIRKRSVIALTRSVHCPASGSLDARRIRRTSRQPNARRIDSTRTPANHNGTAALDQASSRSRHGVTGAPGPEATNGTMSGDASGGAVTVDSGEPEYLAETVASGPSG